MEMSSTIKNVTGVNKTSQSISLLPRSEGIVYAVAFIVEFFVISVGNAFVIAVFSRTRQLRQRKSHWLLINLAIVDFLIGAIAGPLWLYSLAERCDLWNYKPNLYTILLVDTVSLFSSNASSINLAMISLERMYATLWPFKQRVHGTRTYHVMIGLSWSLPIFLPCVSAAERFGQISLDAFNYSWLCSTCFLLLIIIVSYASIWIKIKFYKHPQHHLTTAQDRKLTMSLSLVTAASLVTSFPGVLLSVLVYFPPLNRVLSLHSYLRTLNFAAMLIYASSLVNPIFYAFRMPQFRRAAFFLVCRHTTVPARDTRNRAELTPRIARRSQPNVTVEILSFGTALKSSVVELHV